MNPSRWQNGVEYPYTEEELEQIREEQFEQSQDSMPIEKVRVEKLAELSAACDTAINDGITITTEDGVERRFGGKEQDQINIKQVLDICQAGAPGWLYQGEGEQGKAGDCFWCTAKDARTIYDGLAIDKTEKRTRHNIMKKMVLSLTTVEEVLAVQWGQPLTGQWLEEFNAKMGLLTPIIESMGGGGDAGG